MTTWAELVSAGMVQIDDVRLREQLTASPAQFYRRMAEVIRQAFTLLQRPPELATYLKWGMTEPKYADFQWVSTADSTDEITEVSTGAVGYELCSVVQVTDVGGKIAYTPYAVAVYNAETGVVTFPEQDSAHIRYEIDFYTDGSFPDMTAAQIRLMALAIAVVWDERFSRNWLNMQPKLMDDSFKQGSEANHIAQVAKRRRENRIAFNDELRAYEQLCAYATVVKNSLGAQTELL